MANATTPVIQINEGKVGIGTASPAYKLDVNGSVNASFGNTNGYRINTNRVLSQISGAVEVGVLDYKTTYPNISFNNDNTFRVEQNGSTKIIVNSSGNVGIGTTSPTAALHVQKAISGGFAGTIYNTQATGGFGLSVRGGNSSSQDALRVQNVGGTYLLNVKGNGNVGIGTTNPGEKLFKVFCIINEADGVTVVYNPDGATNRVRAQLKIDSFQGILELTNSGDVTSTYITANGNSYLTGGNVGIGTTSPAYKLDVAGSLRGQGLNSYQYSIATNEINSFGAGTRTMAMPPNGYLWHDLFAFGYNYTVVQEQYDGTTWSSASTQDALFIQKQDQSIEVISSSNTGVRWTFNNVAWSVAQYLNLSFTHVSSDINKNVLVESSTDNSTWTTRFTNTAAAGIGTRTCALSAYNGDAYLRITITKGSVSTNVVRMSQIRLMTSRAGDQGNGMEQQYPYSWNSDRDIGIGTTSPAAKLHVNSSSATAVQRIQGATNSALEFYNSSTKTGAILVNSTQFLIAADNSNYLSINTGGSERMRIDSSGNVGIGTTTPSTKFHVRNGEATIASDTDGVKLSYSSGNSSGIIDTAFSDNNLEFRTNGTAKMWIANGGNVGIGTTSPRAGLQVV